MIRAGLGVKQRDNDPEALVGIKREVAREQRQEAEQKAERVTRADADRFTLRTGPLAVRELPDEATGAEGDRADSVPRVG